MLTNLLIENYRCYANHEVDFRKLTIIVGKNNAGKSTLIEALRLISIASSRFRSVNYREAPKWLDLPKRAKGISPSLKSYGFNIENLFYQYGNPPSKLIATFESNVKVTVYIGPEGEIFCTFQDSFGEYISSKSNALNINIPAVNILPQISPFQKEEKILNRDYVRQNLSSELASIHFRNQLALLSEDYDKFVYLAESSWSGLRVRSLDGRNDIPGNKISLLIQDSDFVAEVGWMGHGLQMWLQIMWFLARTNEDETIILDEPDVYMHPELQRKLIRLLRKRTGQVIVATHSVEIISEVEADNIMIIDKVKNKSIYATKLPVVQRILNSIGSIHNLQLTKLWSSRKLIVVEGEDIAILKRFQSKIYPNSEETFDSIPNFDIGGWGGWNYAKGSSKLLKETVDTEIRIYCIFDSDYHITDEKQLRIVEAKKSGVEIHIWKKKEIENYLLIPSAIHRIIMKESKIEKMHLSESIIEKKIIEICDGWKEKVIQNFADTIQKKDRNLSVSKCIEMAKGYVDDLCNRACGKDVISELSSWTQAEFKVSISPLKIAQYIELAEIDEEIVNIIRAIENCTPFK